MAQVGFCLCRLQKGTDTRASTYSQILLGLRLSSSSSVTTLPTSMPGSNVALWLSTLSCGGHGGLHMQRKEQEHSDFVIRSNVFYWH